MSINSITPQRRVGKDVPDYWERLKHQAVINIYCAYVEDDGPEWSLDQAIKLLKEESK